MNLPPPLSGIISRRSRRAREVSDHSEGGRGEVSGDKSGRGKSKSIELVNEAAEKYFKGSAKELKRLEMTENALKNNSKMVLTEKGISPTIIIGELPVKEKK